MSALNAQGLPTNYPFRKDWELTPRQVKQALTDKADFLLLDCRTPGEYAVANIQGALLFPIQTVISRMDELEEHRQRKIVIHCHHGGRSLQMTMLLRQQGFADVWSMAGGIDLWSLDIDPTVKRY